MHKQLISGIVGVLVGLVIGFFGANALNRDSAVISESNSTANVTTAGPPAEGMTAFNGSQADVQETLDKAATEPTNFVAQMKSGDMYAQIGRFDEAIQFYERGVGLRPTDVQANLVLANAYFDARQFEKAGEQYARVLELEPDNPDARTDLGATYVERPEPDYERAIAEFRKVLEKNAGHAPALYYLGVAQNRGGSKDAARETLARLERNDPANELVSRLRQQIDNQ